MLSFLTFKTGAVYAAPVLFTVLLNIFLCFNLIPPNFIFNLRIKQKVKTYIIPDLHPLYIKAGICTHI